MKRMRLVIAGCLFGLISSVASASSMTARIERILIFEDGNLVYVYPVEAS